MENKQKYAKLKQYVQLFFLIMIAMTIVLILLGNSFGITLLVVSAIGYFGCGIVMRTIPEPDDAEFNIKINFVTKCIQYPTYILLAALMIKTWFERG